MSNLDSLDAHAHAASSSSAQPRLSVVIPLYNESGSLGLLHQRLTAVLQGMPLASYEVVFVDDGSRDNTYAEVAELCAIDPTLKAIRFARNFGKEAAMAAGLRAAGGDVVVLMDGDLQHPPELIPEMLGRWRGGYRGTFEMALEHALYCIGCCWGLMLVLVAFGAAIVGCEAEGRVDDDGVKVKIDTD